MALVAKVYNPTYTTLLSTLTLAEDVGCQPALDEPGSGGLTLPLTAPDHAAALAAQQAACDFRNIVRFEDDGTPVHAVVIRSKTVKRVQPGEEVAQGIDVDGPGTLSLWSKAVLYPENALTEYPHTDVRSFNFSSRLLSTASWTAAVQGEQGTGDPGGPREGFPANMPPEAETAWWIWSQANDVNGSVPPGDAYFRGTYTSVGQFVRIFVTADNSHEFYLDNHLVEVDSLAIAGGVGWAGLKTVDRWLSPGTHLFAFKANNAPGTDPNPAGVIMAVVELVDKGSALGSTLFTTNALSFVALGYPASPPGFTPGHQARIFLEEAQARGALTGWTLGCTDTLDSAGAAWAVAPESAYQVGLDGLAFLQQLAEAYCDIAVDPSSLRLDMWNKGTKGGGASGITLTPGVNVGSMINQGRG